MSTTPRTDAAVRLTIGADFNMVCPNFARKLENELDSLRAEVERLKGMRTAAEAIMTDVAEANEELAIARAEKAEAECLEQARLLGMSGKREADLLSELDAIKRGHGELGKYEQLRLKNAELHSIIDRASVQFYKKGTDKKIAANMIRVLSEVLP